MGLFYSIPKDLYAYCIHANILDVVDCAALMRVDRHHYIMIETIHEAMRRQRIAKYYSQPVLLRAKQRPLSVFGVSLGQACAERGYHRLGMYFEPNFDNNVDYFDRLVKYDHWAALRHKIDHLGYLRGYAQCLAALNGHWNTVRSLGKCTQYKEGLAPGGLPEILWCIVKSDLPDMIQWYVDTFGRGGFDIERYILIAEECCRNGSIHIMEWTVACLLLYTRCKFHAVANLPHCLCNIKFIDLCATHGQYSMLRWFHQKGRDIFELQSPWYVRYQDGGTHMQSIEYMEFFLSIGATLPPFIPLMDSSSLKSVVWLISHGAEMPLPSDMYPLFYQLFKCWVSDGASHGIDDIITWFQNAHVEWTEDYYKLAIVHDKLYAVQALRRAHCPWNWETCAHAITHDRPEIVQWLVENGCPWDPARMAPLVQLLHLQTAEMITTAGEYNPGFVSAAELRQARHTEKLIRVLEDRQAFVRQLQERQHSATTFSVFDK